MTTPYAIQRRFTRIFFSKEVKGIISSVENKQELISVAILNISEGGLQFRQQRTSNHDLQINDHLILHQLIDFPELKVLTDIPMQIKWIMDNKHLGHVSVGTKFNELSKIQRETLRTFVDACLALSQSS